MKPYFAPALRHPVEAMDRALAFFEEILEMPILGRGPGWALVDNGAIAIRLEPLRPEESPRELEIELRAKDFEGARALLLEHPEISALGEIEWPRPDRKEQRLQGPFGVRLRLAREYDEDELGVIPDLPTSLEWEPEAVRLVQALLRRIPVDFRESARVRGTRRAEELAIRDGEVLVDPHLGVRAMAQITPAIRVPLVQEALRELDLDPARWAADFER